MTKPSSSFKFSYIDMTVSHNYIISGFYCSSLKMVS